MCTANIRDTFAKAGGINTAKKPASRGIAAQQLDSYVPPHQVKSIASRKVRNAV